MSEIAKTGKTRSWAKAQKDAIDFPGKGLLLSAGAGSGKTAVLTERVCNLVCDEECGIPISRMLIVTFTVAASKELKDRIAQRLAKELDENPDSEYIIKQTVELGNANISTISSFFYKAVRPFAAELSLPPDFRVAEEALTEVMKKRIMNDVVDDFFESDNEDFIILADTLGNPRNEDSLSEVILKIAKNLTQKGIDAETVSTWASRLEASATGDFFETANGQAGRGQLVDFFEHYTEFFKQTRKLLAEDSDVLKGYGKGCDALISECERLCGIVKTGSFANVSSALCGFEKLPSMGSLREDKKTEAAEYYQEHRKTFWNKLKELRGVLFSAGEKEIGRLCVQTEKICRVLGDVLGEFYSRFESEKKDRGLVEFSDLEVYAKRIFCNPDGSPTEHALEYSRQFDCIFIDEYQDTNETQDAVFSAVSQGIKRFMVGDVKQSIYAFRGADPSVFNSYRAKWKPYEEAKKSTAAPKDIQATIFMNGNFRSDEGVIDFSNLVSEYMFPGSDTPFEKEDRLVFSKNHPDGYKEKRSEICCLLRSEADKKEKRRYEAEYVAERIASMLKNELKADGTPYKAGDFAILLRNKSSASDFCESLAKRGVATHDSATEKFFERPEILLVLCILNAIDNPLGDIYLAGAMKSPAFGFSVSDLVKIRIGKKDRPLWYCVEEYASKGNDPLLVERCVNFIRFEEEFRSRSRRCPSDVLLRAIYERLSLMSMGERDEDFSGVGARIRRNLTSLYEYARQYERVSYTGLYGFISYLGELMESEAEGEKAQVSDDAVTVTTIHKSKGLEFPVCFICEATKDFSTKDATAEILVDKDIGIALNLQDESGCVRCATPMKKILAEKIQTRAVCEEMRVLYVAMTRASERCIVVAEESAVGAWKDLRRAARMAKFDMLCATPYSKMRSKNYLSWILPSAQNSIENNDFPCFDMNYVALHGGEFTCIEAEKKAEETVELESIFEERFSFEYPYSYLEKIPSKLTVSKLKPDVLDEDSELDSLESFYSLLHVETGLPGGEVFSKDYEQIKVAEEAAPRPAFMSESVQPDYAFKGTSTHVFLQFCDFEGLIKNGFEEERKRLLEKGFMTERMAQNVDAKQIKAFIDSSLIKEVLSASFVKREFRFNVALPAADFTENEELKQVLLENGCDIITQGVCDLVYENDKGELILVDYKTDRLTEAELENVALAEKKLKERHTRQLSYYKRAVEGIFGKTVSKTAVYSLPLGDTVDII